MAELEMIQVLPIQDMENQEHAYSDFDVKAKDKLVIIEGYRCSFIYDLSNQISNLNMLLKPM